MLILKDAALRAAPALLPLRVCVLEAAGANHPCLQSS